jgi:hypothetical protein
MKLRYTPIAVGLFLSIVSCTPEQRGKSRGAIVLGDSSTIVTETNVELLQDQVVDLRPSITSDEDMKIRSPARLRLTQQLRRLPLSRRSNLCHSQPRLCPQVMV